MAKLAPIFNDAQFINAIPANGAKLFTYAAGSSTKLATYTDEDGLIAQSNPIILNSRGEPAQPIWLLEGLKYKFVFAPSTDTDPPVSPIRTIDDISGINDTSLTIDQWVDSGLTPTYVSATSFTVAGDQTSLFTNKRRIKSLVTAGTAYSTVLTSTFGALTTVVVVNDNLPLDTGLSTIQVGLLTPNNPSIPSLIESYRATVAATATTTPLWASTAQVQEWTGAPTITDLPDAPQPGAWRMVYPTVGTIFTDNANLDVQGNANYTVEAGDKVYIEALTISTFKVFIEKQTGAPILIPDASTTVKGIVELATQAEVLTGTSTTLVPSVDSMKKGTTGFSAVNTTTGGTTIAFTSIIPTWANEFTVHFRGFSTNGTATWILQAGVAGVYVTTGYDSFGMNFSGGALSGGSETTGIAFLNAAIAANSYGGHITFKRTASTNVWSAVGGIASGSTAGGQGFGVIDAGGVLDSVRWTTVGGANTVDVNGGVSVSWSA
jgi:hypothetical protein